jgi:hypothetical protein
METRDDTKPIKIPYPVGKKPKGLYFTIAALVITVIVLGFILLKTVFHKEDMEQTVPAETNEIAAVNMQTVQPRLMEIRDLETNLHQRQQEVASLFSDYKDKVGADIPSIDILNLSEQEREILQKKMDQEGDVSIQSILKDILKKEAEIIQLKGKIEKIEAVLPSPHIVTKGETHFVIAFNYLVKEKGVPEDKAKEIIDKTSLFDDLLPGFKVWNFYSGREYGSFVTQGSAAISPYEAKQRVRQRIIARRDKALKQLSNKEKKEKEYQKQINSLHYRLDSKKNMIDNGILEQKLFKSAKLKDVTPENFNLSVDLRETDTIMISAADFGLKRIKKVNLYPRFYKEGNDYEIIISKDKQTARLIIRDKEKFKNERIAVSVE